MAKKRDMSAKSILKSSKEKRNKAIDDAVTVVLRLTPAEKKLLGDREIVLPAEHLSVSQMELYDRCPKAYFGRYVEKVKGKVSLPPVEGQTHHTCFDVNNKNKIRTGKDLTGDFMANLFERAFNNIAPEIDDWGNKGDTVKSVVKRGRLIQKAYILTLAPRITPLRSEHCFKLKLGPIIIVGFIDLVAKFESMSGTGKPVKTIFDYKIVGRAKSQHDADDSGQLATYIEAEGRTSRATKAGFIYGIKPSASVRFQTANITEKRIADVRLAYIKTAIAITKGNFPKCRPGSNYLCSKLYCDYWDKCKNKRRG